MFNTTDLLVGVDIHRHNNVVQLMAGTGEILSKALQFTNNRSGTDQLITHLITVAKERDFQAIHIAGEATNHYWLLFFCHLQQTDLLNQFRVVLYPFNPKRVHRFRGALGDLNKTDELDTMVIVERLRLGRKLPCPFEMDEHYNSLRTLTRYRYHLVQQLVRAKSHALSLIYLKSSEYTADPAFSDIFGKTSRAVLTDFQSMETIIQTHFNELVEWLDQKGMRRFPNPENNARRLVSIANESYLLPEEWAKTVHETVSLSLRHISSLEQLLKRTDKAIEHQMKQYPNSLMTIPGIGSVLGAGLLAEIGDLARFDYRHDKVASYTGLKWSKNQSGDYTGEETNLKRTGNRYLRYYFCEAAQSVRIHDSEYAAYYKKKFNEVRLHQHKRAIVLTARKLVRLVVRLLTTNEPYRARQVKQE